MRLDKYLAETAQCTRSEAKALLAKGRVTGERCTSAKKGTPSSKKPTPWPWTARPLNVPAVRLSHAQ